MAKAEWIPEKNSIMDLKEQKRTIRKSVLNKRDALPEEQRKMADMAMADRIIGHQWFYGAEILLTFVNYGSEISTIEIIEEALRKGKKVFVPRIEKAADVAGGSLTDAKSEDIMNFYQITSRNQLIAGYKGIPEPDGTTECFDYNAYKERRMLLLMPGVAFDIYGNRMGYGKGFYDRYLRDKEMLQTFSIAIGYKCQSVEFIPVEEHDLKPYQVILV